MSLPLIEIFFSLILLLLWFFLINLRERYLELDLKGWGEMSLGIFFVFLGSLLELAGDVPKFEKYLYVGNMPWGEFSKIILYIIGIVLVLISPISWLPSVLEERSMIKQASKKFTKMNSFLSKLNGAVSQVEEKQALSFLLNSALTHLCAELKTQSGAIFLFLKNSEKKELALTYFLGLSLETVDKLMKTKPTDIRIFTRSIENKRIEISGELLNSDRRLALAVKEHGFESCICIPLFSEVEDLGVIALFSPNRYYFKYSENEILSELATALSRRIQYIKTIEILEQKENELKKALEKERFLKLIAEDLTKGNPEEALRQIVKAGSEIFHPCECKIYLREGDSTILKATSELDDSKKEIDLPIEEWLKNGFQDDELRFISEELDPKVKLKGVEKIVLVPLKDGKSYYGMIVFECKTQIDSFSSGQNFVRTLALQASEALRRIYAAKALDYKESLLNSLFEAIDDRITVHDKNQKIIRINKAGLRLLNLTENEVLGKSCYQVLYQQNLPEACTCYFSFKEKKSCFQQIKFSKEKSEGLLKVWTHPVLNNRGEVEMVLEYAKLEGTPIAVSGIDPGKKEVPKEFFNNLNNILAGILGNAELIMFQAKSHKDFNHIMMGEQINLIEELVIQGSKLIREAKGESEKIPEKEQILEKKVAVGEEKKIDKALKILAIDDQKIIRDLLESILQGLGHQVKVSSSGSEGMELFQRDGYDLVITDLGMPDMSGWEVSRGVKQIRKETPVVMITGWGMHFDLEKIREFGVDYLLSKPFKVEQLSKLIDLIKVEKLKGKL